MRDYFNYRFSNDIEFNINKGEFVSIVGNANDLIVHTILKPHPKCNIFVGDIEFNKENIDTFRKRVGIVLYRHLDIFVAETVKDEIAFGLESLAYTKDDITQLIESESRLFKLTELLERDPYSLGSSDKVKMKILSALIIKPEIIVLDNIVSELDYKDKILVFNILKEYTKSGGIVINLASDTEDTLVSTRIIIINDKKVVIDGNTLDVLKEIELLEKVGVGVPYIVKLNKELINEGIIDKYYLSYDKLVKEICK